jgi:hypothetical protein
MSLNKTNCYYSFGPAHGNGPVVAHPNLTPTPLHPMLPRCHTVQTVACPRRPIRPPFFSSPTWRRAAGPPPSLLFPRALSLPPLPFPFPPLPQCATPPYTPWFPSSAPTDHAPPSAQIVVVAAFFPSAESSTSTASHRRSLTTVKHRRTTPFSPPRRPITTVSSRRFLLARRLTRDSVELMPATSEHLGR